MEKPMSRRAFLARTGFWTFAAAALGTGVYGTLVETRHLAVERVTVYPPGLPADLDGLRLGHLSDLHAGHYSGLRTWVSAVETMASLHPDLVVVTGDIMHHTLEGLDEVSRTLGTLRPPLGCFAVLGNHDHAVGDPRTIPAALEEAGVRMLTNRNVHLAGAGTGPANTNNPDGDTGFWLAGIDDLLVGRPDPRAALSGIPPGAFTVLLVHEPDFADQAARMGVALQLSGHSHGGQVRLPLLGPLILPSMARRYPMGLQRVVGNHTLVYTHRGIGVTGPPVRFRCRPEVALLELRAGA